VFAAVFCNELFDDCSVQLHCHYGAETRSGAVSCVIFIRPHRSTTYVGAACC